MALLPEIADLATQVGKRIEQFVGQFARYRARAGGCPPGAGLRAAIGPGRRRAPHPNWSQVEIEWEQVSEFVQRLSAVLTDLLLQTGGCRWPISIRMLKSMLRQRI